MNNNTPFVIDPANVKIDEVLKPYLVFVGEDNLSGTSHDRQLPDGWDAQETHFFGMEDVFRNKVLQNLIIPKL